MPQIRYAIRNVGGTPEAFHVREDQPGKKKQFKWKSPDETFGLAGRPLVELPLYGTERIPKYSTGSLVVIVEGEKATDALVKRDFRAFGSVTGSATCHADAVLETLNGFEVAVWPDNDDVGPRTRRRLSRRVGAHPRHRRRALHRGHRRARDHW